MTQAALGWVSGFTSKVLLPSSANVLGRYNHSHNPCEAKHHGCNRALQVSSLEKVVMGGSLAKHFSKGLFF